MASCFYFEARSVSLEFLNRPDENLSDLQKLRLSNFDPQLAGTALFRFH